MGLLLAVCAGGEADAGLRNPHTDRPHLDQPHLGRPHLDQPHLGRPHLGRPHLGRPHLDQPHLGRPHLDQPRLGRPHLDRPHLDRPALLTQLRRDDFAGIETRLNGLRQAYEAGRDSDAAMLAAFRDFEVADPALEAHLGRWVERCPASAAARLARAAYLRHLGWLTRSGGQATAESRGYFDRARGDLEAALDLLPSLGLTYGLLIDLAMAEGDATAADRLVRAGLEADPRSYALRRFYLHALRPWWRAAMEPEQVLADLEAFVAKLSEDAAALPALEPLRGFTAFVTAEILRRQRRHGQAESYYRQALGFGADWEYLRQRGANAFAQENYAQALDHFEGALAERPRDPVLLDWRGRARWALGDRAAARGDWTRALALDPWNPVILLHQAESLRTFGQPAAAARALDRALVYGGENPRVRAARGRLYLTQLGQPRDAVADLARATELDPHDDGTWYDYARALHGLGDCAAPKALTAYRALCENGVRCAAERLDWADATWTHYQNPLICPVFGILGP